MAEREGFEPSRRERPSGLANRPLDHLGTSPYKAAAAHLKVRKSGLPHMEGRTSKKDKLIREREKSNQSGCKRPCSENLLFPYTPKYIWKADVPQPQVPHKHQGVNTLVTYGSLMGFLMAAALGLEPRTARLTVASSTD